MFECSFLPCQPPLPIAFVVKLCPHAAISGKQVSPNLTGCLIVNRKVGQAGFSFSMLISTEMLLCGGAAQLFDERTKEHGNVLCCEGMALFSDVDAFIYFVFVNY